MTTSQVSTSLLTKVDGSAQLSVGGTKVVVSVTGPIEPKLRQELPTQTSFEIIIRPAVGVSSTREKLMEDKLLSLLQNVIARFQNPRQLVQIVIQFLITDPIPNHYTNSQLSAAANACYYALVDANVPLLCSFAAVPIAIHKNEIIANPAPHLIAESESNHVVCYGIHDAHADSLLLVESQGSFTSQQLFAVLDMAQRECNSVHQQQRSYLQQKVSQDFIWKQ
jgi:exosome complex component RRP46